METTRKSLSTEEVKALLDSHREYIKSDGYNGKPSDFRKSSILGMRIEKVNFTNSNFREAIIHDVAFVNCLFQNVDFTDSTVCGVKFEDCLFVNCDLVLKDWTHHQLLGCNFFYD